MTVRELRSKYLRFFESKGHSVHSSGSLVPYDVTGRLDESLLFNGAGMIQFKPYFRGVAKPANPRLATAQKCVRTGDVESVGDLSHLTFFEMMGNFSFGDYFRLEAIDYSWEFLTDPDWLGLAPHWLSFTVFHSDDEAWERWAYHVQGAGLDPEHRVFRLGEETNYWPAGAFTDGPPGPCGPNTEIFYWVAPAEPPTGPYTVEQWRQDEEAQNWLEIWNDVFIQYEWQGRLRNPDRPAEGYEKTGMPDLPFKSIDTGMGLERTAAVLSGFASVYDTDAFAPILRKIAELGVTEDEWSASAGRADEMVYGQDPVKDRAIRIVADHIRTACFCIAEGILPGNSGRGYVLRRLIRRAILKGSRTLGFGKIFLYQVVGSVIETLGDHYPELVDRHDVIVETLRHEEALFRRTLEQGTSLLQAELDALESNPTLSGAIAFRLYDTFGFPLEVTQELCEEAGVGIDLDTYETALREAQERSRGGQDRATVYGGVRGAGFADVPPTEFIGYEAVAGIGTLLAIEETGGEFVAVFDKTPFYAESGGQVADEGWITVDGSELPVTGVRKQDSLFIHRVAADVLAISDRLGQALPLRVDAYRRGGIKRNHTATHLLHATLREVLGSHVTQAGSYVGPDRLRFDFTHGKALEPLERAQIERRVNEEIWQNIDVITHADLPIDEARARGAMALFGEKYGDRVRMVEIGEFSRELCGGIHVRSTGEIGLFQILSESSAASGVRRIEAVTGEGAYANLLEALRTVEEASILLRAPSSQLVDAVAKTLEQLKEERRKREKAEANAISAGSKSASERPAIQDLGGVRLFVRNFGEVDPKVAAQALDNAVAQDPGLVAVAAVLATGKPNFSAKCGPEALARGAHAGNLLREVAKIAGGGGGGRAEFATAGGKDPEKVDEALSQARSILSGMLS